MSRHIILDFILIAVVGVCSCKPQGKKYHQSEVNKTVKKQLIHIDTLKAINIIEPDLNELVNRLNKYLAAYDSIAAMAYYDTIEFRNLRIEKSEMDTVNMNADESGKIPGWSIAAALQGPIDELINKVLSHPKMYKYDLKKIINHIDIVESADGKLYNLILPENTGGSYKSNISYLYYRLVDGTVNFNKDGSDGFNKIYTLSTKHGLKYVLYGSVQGCNTCIGEYIELLHFDSNGVAHTDFSLSTGERLNDDGNGFPQGIFYDEKHAVIKMTHNANDDQECDCRTDVQRENDNEQISLVKGKNWICIYKFNGDTFFLDKRNSRAP